MISRKHSNRKAYNWLFYDIGDNCLKEYSKYYRGVMYDLGCGEAPFKEYFLRYVDEYVGVDWAGSYHNTEADVSANLNNKLPINSGVADTVVSLSVMEHLSEPQLFLFETYRIMKDEAVLIMQVPWQWWIHEAPYDFFRYTPYGLTYLLKKAGFKDIVVKPQAGYFTTAILKFNYFTARMVRGDSILKLIIKAMLYPLWYLGQVLAPFLDKLDKNWSLESPGYYVVATKR